MTQNTLYSDLTSLYNIDECYIIKEDKSLSGDCEGLQDDEIEHIPDYNERGLCDIDWLEEDY